MPDPTSTGPASSGPSNERQTTWILWIAFVTAVALYGGVGAWLVHSGSVGGSAEGLPRTEILVLGLAVVALGATGFVAMGGGLFARTSDFRTWSIVRWAVSETIALFGLVLAVLGAGLLPLAVGMLWAWGLLLLTLPTQREQQRFQRLAARSGD